MASRIHWSVASLLLLSLLAATHAGGQSTSAWTRAIAIADADGENLEFIAKEPAPGLVSNGSPRWSPDGKSIVYDSVTADPDWSRNRIFVVYVAGKRKGETQELGYGTAPSWSPDGSQIAFFLNPGNPLGDQRGCWVMNADGTGREFLCEGWYPRWSPKGDQIALMSYTAGTTPVLFDLRKGKATSVRVQIDIDKRLCWGPKSQQLAFVTEDAIGQQLNLVQLSGPAPVVTRVLLIDEQEPRGHQFGIFDWSRDGERIVTRIYRNKESDGIYTYELGSDQPPKRILSRTATQTYSDVCWSPNCKQIAVAVSRKSE